MIHIRIQGSPATAEVNPLYVAAVYYHDHTDAEIILCTGTSYLTHREDAELVSDAVAAVNRLTPENVRAHKEALS